MRIRRIEPIAVNLPMKKPVEMAGEIVSIAENLLVRIEANTGVIGWGEAASAPTMTGETTASMLAAVRYLTPALQGCDVDPMKIRHAMHMRMYGNHGAKAAIDMALYDLLGRATGRPAHALLGEKRRDRVQALAVIGSKDLSADQREAKAKRSEGYTCFKIKVGMNAADVDGERTRAICEAIGGGVQISADANQGWSREEALRYLRGSRRARSTSSSSRWRQKIWIAWLLSLPPAGSRSEPMKGFTRWPTCAGIRSAASPV